jgi:hypothetical protein
MNTRRKPPAGRIARNSDSGKIKRLTKKLTQEDQKLELPLLDAAVAGAILGFRPTDKEMRRQAELAWETIRPQLSQHLLSEDDTLLPWAEHSKGLSVKVVERLKAQHHELRSLARKLAGVSFEKDADGVVAPAGRALCMLAIKLDDLIDSEETGLLPALRKVLFA